MKLYSLIPVVLAFFLPVSFCLCSAPDTLFFSTHSSRPWSHHQRWGLPFLQPNPLPVQDTFPGDITRTSGLSACNPVVDSMAPAILNLTSGNFLAENRQPLPSSKTSRSGMPSKPSPELGKDMAQQPSGNLTESGSGRGRQAGENEGFSACDGIQTMDMNANVRAGASQVLYAIGLIIWLVLLIYLMGSTASDYFSCTLEQLSEVLNLSPSVAGVTLLAIGNGAPDVFSSVVAFASSDRTGSIGFGSALGGALFITTVISGIVSLVASRGSKEPRVMVFGRYVAPEAESVGGGSDSTIKPDGSVEEGTQSGRSGKSSLIPADEDAALEGSAKVDTSSFVRDVLFLLLTVGTLTVVLLDGEVQLGEAIGFFCIYPIYAVFVWIMELLQKRRRSQRSSLQDLLIVKATLENSLPQWADVHQIPQHPHYHVHTQDVEAEMERLWEDPTDHSFWSKLRHLMLMFYKYCIEWPLGIPRQFTIPIVEEERWSRKTAVASCTLAPVFVAAVWAIYNANSVVSALVALGIGAGVGIVLGILAFFGTDDDVPPQRFLTLWLAGGFVMSVVWFYLVANALVDALETLGDLFSINTTILALTVLAWGNSVGDLVADLSLAIKERNGVQIAISGCYAGPLFNTLVGLGVALILACAETSPDAYQIVDKDGSLFYILGFLAIGLVWALVMLLLQGMRLTRSLGIGLIVLYCGFFVVGVLYAMGLLT